jgi:hypothetical protein
MALIVICVPREVSCHALSSQHPGQLKLTVLNNNYFGLLCGFLSLLDHQQHKHGT